MKNFKLFLISIFSLTLLFGFLPVKHAFADTFTLSGSVKDTSGNGISGTIVSVNDANSDNTTTDSSGNYSLSIPAGTYNVQVTPPSGSGFTSAVAVNQNISANTVINFVLVPSGTVTLSGHVLDGIGQPLANQTVAIAPSGTGNYVSSTTDSNGNYNFQVTPGNYLIRVSGNNSLSANAPATYSIQSSATLSLQQSKIMNIPLNIYKMSLLVQDSSGNPQANVKISTNAPSETAPIGTVTNTSASSNYSSSAGLTTDATGSATLWLFPTSNGNNYTITAVPPTGSSFVTTNLSGVTLTANKQVTLTMATPVTLSGRVLDGTGQPLTNQTVAIAPSGTSNYVSSVTDSSGNYNFSVAPGNYLIRVSGSNPVTANAPASYSIQSSGTLSLTQNKVMDIPLTVYSIALHVQDINGSPVSNIKISTNAPSETAPIGTVTNTSASSSYSNSAGLVTDASGNATLWLFPTSFGNNYTITGTPPTGSSFTTTSISGVTLTANSQQTLTMKAPVTLSGRVLDGVGQPLANQTVAIAPSGTSNYVSSTTDANGNYNFSTTTGNYLIKVSGSNSVTANAPASYLIQSNAALTLSQNTTMDIPLNVKKVTLLVQDAVGNPQANIGISTNGPSETAPIGTVTNTSATSSYSTSTGLKTDNSGIANVWLFPTSNGNNYTITATPPNGSIFNTFSLSSVTVTQDETEVISLQYNHATPTTTATLSPAPDNQGNYSDPTSVTLSATAASGYTIPNGNTFYTIDGGSQQTYSSPFTITGNGSHTITYWSIDNSGVQETHNTKTFTILATYSLSGTVYNDVNQNGFQDTGETGYSGATVTLNSGQSTTTDSNGNYSFSNIPAGTYVETLTVPNGYSATTTNPVNLQLAANTTQNFGIAQNNSLVTAINAGGSNAGNFVSDTDFSGGSSYTTSATVDTSGVSNPAPQAVYQTVRYGNFTYTIPNLTPNANYTVKLHFNELYWGTDGNDATGKRVFNVSVNGTQVLSNYDIYAKAGGTNKAIVEQLPVTADNNGDISIQFATVVDNAMVNGIELYNGTLPTPTPTAMPTPASSALINAGGSTAGNFAADTDYIGGQPFTSSASVDTSNVTNPAPQSVYQSVRYGNFTYTVPNLSPNTNYLVRLHFNELYWNSAGSRVFNVKINGSQVLTNYDIFQAAGGENKAVVEDFVVPSDSNGKLAIQFISVTDNAMVNGIEIIPPTVPARTYYTKNDGSNFIRSTSAFSSGVETQNINADGSVNVSINNTSNYADSGFVLYEGTLGNLPNFTTLGTGDQYGLNLWFDKNSNNEYFAWDSDVLTGLDGDTYALSNGSQNGKLNVNGGTSFFLMSDGQNHTLADLKNGAVSGIDANTKVAVWVGVNTSSGSTSSTIQSILGL
jgi:protocatechuate 3,4-dioxygenase beta subunit